MKLIQTIGTLKTQTIEQLETISNNLLSGIDRETIKTELTPSNATIINGTFGIVWVYKQFFELTSNNRFKQEMEYWTNQCFLFEEVDNGFAGYDFEDEDNAFGLLEGLAGIGLYNDTILQFNSLVTFCHLASNI